MGVSAKQNLLKLNPALIRNITKIEKNKNKNKSRPITKATVKNVDCKAPVKIQ